MAIKVNFKQGTDHNRTGWWFSVPYNAEFVSELKFTISSRRRSYNPSSHEWFVEHGVLPTAVRLIRTFFKGASIGYDGEFKENREVPPRERPWRSPWEDEEWYKRTQQRVSNETSFYDPYQVFGLSRGASYDDCNKRYRELAKQWHPSRNGGVGAEEMMKKINEAWSVIRKDKGK